MFGLAIPNPPSLVGRANIIIAASETGIARRLGVVPLKSHYQSGCRGQSIKPRRSKSTLSMKGDFKDVIATEALIGAMC